MMSNNTVGFLSPEHEADFISAVTEAGAVKADYKINAYYGASLFLLTGLRSIWPRLRQHVGTTYIDFGAMLDYLHLSTGEALIVRLSGNLYNGGFWMGSPWDLLSDLDGELFALVLEALRLRKSGMRLFGGEVTAV